MVFIRFKNSVFGSAHIIVQIRIQVPVKLPLNPDPEGQKIKEEKNFKKISNTGISCMNVRSNLDK